jgi:lipopolysaccharide/colanic/teichoic acid biosynthesis glycosyltransferase
MKMIYKKYLKRILDFSLSVLGLLIISPIFIIIFVLLLIANNGKPFFFQSRPGKNGKVFKIIKFKTMNDKVDEDGEFLSFDQRVTTVGNLLRKTSFDEIPQLINVVIGNMSLIGPRPLLEDYLPLYNDFQKRRHNMKPGITGWAQVNGRNAISWEEKFKFDVWYIDNVSFMVDIKIILLTIKKVFLKEGVNNQDKISMIPFAGNKTNN